jgi:hypothetical protein
MVSIKLQLSIVNGWPHGFDGPMVSMVSRWPHGFPVQPKASRRVASIAADLRRHHSSTTGVVSSFFLATRPLSTQRGHTGFVRRSESPLSPAEWQIPAMFPDSGEIS